MPNPIEILEQSKVSITEKYKRDLHEIDKAIDQLRQQNPSVSTTANFPEPVIRDGQYAEMKTADAIRDYLRQVHGGPVPLPKIMAALRKGGIGAKWQSGRFEHNVKISIGNNAGILHYDEEMDTVRLSGKSSRIA